MRDSGNPNSRFADTLKRIGISLLRLFRGDFPVFLLFLAITFFFWWSQTMNQDYDTAFRIPVKVTGIPENVRVLNNPSDHITLSLNGKGTALRKSARRASHHVVNVSNSLFNMNQGHASLPTQWLRDSISAILHSSVSIRSIEPDSLVYHYALQSNRMIPVVFNGTIESQDQFYMERIEFEPDSLNALVLLSDTSFKEIAVDLESITVQSDTTVLMARLKPAPRVILDDDKVQMTVISQQYTEKSIEVPVTGVNFPDSVSLKSFPSKAVVTVWVKMSEYDRIGSRDFQVVVDYNDIKVSDVSKAPLRIFSQPANVRNVRLQTRTVDFLMERHIY